MDSNELALLTKEELLAKVKELSAELESSNTLMNKVREHKHNYSEDFGLVVSAPLQGLVKELLTNPDTFTPNEQKQILDYYSISAELRGTYECLGWPIAMQLKRVREYMVPQIRKNEKLFASITEKTTEFKDPWLVSKLRMALNETESLCSNLINIEYFDYGTTTPFNLGVAVLDTFRGQDI